MFVNLLRLQRPIKLLNCKREEPPTFSYRSTISSRSTCAITSRSSSSEELSSIIEGLFSSEMKGWLTTLSHGCFQSVKRLCVLLNNLIPGNGESKIRFVDPFLRRGSLNDV